MNKVKATAPYHVELFATRALRNPDTMGEHENSLRSLDWHGYAGSKKKALEKAKRCLFVALAGIAAMTGKRLDHALFCVDHLVESEEDSHDWESFALGEVVSEQIEKKRQGKKLVKKGSHVIENVLRSAMAYELATSKTPPGPGKHILDVTPDDEEMEFASAVDASYRLHATSSMREFASLPRSELIETLTTLAATYMLANPFQEEVGRPMGQVEIPESATLAAAKWAALRSNRVQEAASAAAFMRSFGFEAEALAFEATP